MKWHQIRDRKNDSAVLKSIPQDQSYQNKDQQDSKWPTSRKTDEGIDHFINE